jgi:hypothetical protein
MKPQGLPCCGSNNYKKFASGSSAPERKTPDREENVLLLIQNTAIEISLEELLDQTV